MKTQEEIEAFRNFVFNTLKHEPLPNEKDRQACGPTLTGRINGLDYPGMRWDQHRAFLVRTLKALDWVLGNDAADPIFKVHPHGVYETEYTYRYGLDETEEQLKCRNSPMQHSY